MGKPPRHGQDHPEGGTVEGAASPAKSQRPLLHLPDKGAATDPDGVRSSSARDPMGLLQVVVLVSLMLVPWGLLAKMSLNCRLMGPGQGYRHRPSDGLPRAGRGCLVQGH